LLQRIIDGSKYLYVFANDRSFLMSIKKAASALLLLGLCWMGGCATMGEDSSPDAGPNASQSQQGPNDAEITSAVKAALKEDDLLATSDITVTAEQGVVTLSGSVPNALAYNRAISVARRVPGVQPPVVAANLIYP
jgi:hyperosmotically inducible protein